MSFLNKYKVSIIMFAFFETLAVVLWQISGQLFFLFNFSYIGGFVSLGIGLMMAKKTQGRLFIQLAVGTYMFAYLGVFSGENIAIEGFWYYLFTGVFETAVVHYFIAKVFGPLLFGRGWCGYACWSAMIFDLLPFRQSVGERQKRLGIIRYILLLLAIVFAAVMAVTAPSNIDRIMFVLFITGNILFYIVGIILAFYLKDNRAFCKYICPTSVILKATSYFALLRVKCDEDKCISCGRCQEVCPMNVDVMDNSRRRANRTECIQCMQCKTVCPTKALT